ncbi:DUF6252 family protein [Flavobacterium sp.]|jgi:hypothetical protein|uniref:DUF6252 family protein n=1 Tax=Flavobacterium sp. TaxID=239 RepID=UPI0037BF261F
MKKIASLIVILVAFISCTTDVKFNTPGFQAYKDGVLFRGLDVKAYKSASTGTISLVAMAQDEQVTINTASAALGTYYFGTTDTNTEATYSSSFNSVSLMYETNIIYGPVSKMSGYLYTGGSGYTSDCILTNGVYVCSNSHPTTNSGTGSGLTLSVIANAAGAVTSVKIASPGNGYKAGDLVTITGGGANATITVLNVEGSNGEVSITENTGDTVTGNFKFNAINTSGNPLGGEQVNFQYGTFYKVPLQAAP